VTAARHWIERVLRASVSRALEKQPPVRKLLCQVRAALGVCGREGGAPVGGVTVRIEDHHIDWCRPRACKARHSKCSNRRKASSPERGGPSEATNALPLCSNLHQTPLFQHAAPRSLASPAQYRLPRRIPALRPNTSPLPNNHPPHNTSPPKTHRRKTPIGC